MDTQIPPKKPETSALVATLPDIAPTHIIEIEVGQPLPDISAFDQKTGQHYRRARCLVRLHAQPLGLVS